MIYLSNLYNIIYGFLVLFDISILPRKGNFSLGSLNLNKLFDVWRVFHSVFLLEIQFKMAEKYLDELPPTREMVEKYKQKLENCRKDYDAVNRNLQVYDSYYYFVSYTDVTYFLLQHETAN